MKILLDTNVLPADVLIAVLKQRGHSVVIAQATADREIKDTDLVNGVKDVDVAKETFLFGEGTFPITFNDNTNKLEKILAIISTNSFPMKRENLTKKQRNQLRDALIFESAINDGCDVVCSKDEKAFYKHGKKEQLEREFNIRIFLPDELLDEINA